MSTLAEELLNDFGDDGSEDGSEVGSDSRPQEQSLHDTNGANGIEDESVEDEDDEDGPGLDDVDNEEEAKAKVEKMQLGGVSDVRSVAGLMKTLEPVLEVGLPFHSTPAIFDSI